MAARSSSNTIGPSHGGSFRQYRNGVSGSFTSGVLATDPQSWQKRGLDLTRSRGASNLSTANPTVSAVLSPQPCGGSQRPAHSGSAQQSPTQSESPTRSVGGGGNPSPPGRPAKRSTPSVTENFRVTVVPGALHQPARPGGELNTPPTPRIPLFNQHLGYLLAGNWYKGPVL